MSPGQSSTISNTETQEQIISEKKPIKRACLEEDIEYDVVVRLPPKRSYLVKLKIESIRRAEPNIVEPEIP